MRKRLIVLATALAFACLLAPNVAFASAVPVTIEVGADGAPVGTSGEGWTYADGKLTLDAGCAFTFTGHALNVSSENLLRNKGVIARSGTRNSSTEAGVEARRAQALAKHDRLQAGTGEPRRTRRDGRCAPAANCAGHRASRRRRNADLRDRHADHAEKAERPLVANERGHRQRTGHVERQHGGPLHETRPFFTQKDATFDVSRSQLAAAIRAAEENSRSRERASQQGSALSFCRAFSQPRASNVASFCAPQGKSPAQPPSADNATGIAANSERRGTQEKRAARLGYPAARASISRACASDVSVASPDSMRAISAGRSLSGSCRRSVSGMAPSSPAALRTT